MPEVIVVGAGISGLSAAWHLRSAGVEVLTLEASARAGGRIWSGEVNGCTVERGANFLTDAYRIIPQLAQDLGITLQPVHNHSAIAIDGTLRTFRADRPLSAVRAGVLPLGSALTQVRGLTRFAMLARDRGSCDPVDWLSLDPLTVDEWAQAAGLTTMAAHSWRPAFNGFYFQDTATTSAAAVAAMAGHGLRQQTLTMPGGLSSLTDALAAKLDVRTGVEVSWIEETSTGVAVRTTAGAVHAGAVVVAVPGPALPRLMRLDPVEAAVTTTPYSAGLLVSLGTERRLDPDELGGAYGVLMHPDEGPLAALCVASRAGHAREGGDVITCMLDDRAARRLADRPDAEIVAGARQALLRWLPGADDLLSADPTHTLVTRIPHAMPTSPPGRVARIEAYRRHAQGRRVVLAGDYLAWPWTDSASFTGRWAAQSLVENGR